MLRRGGILKKLVFLKNAGTVTQCSFGVLLHSQRLYQSIASVSLVSVVWFRVSPLPVSIIPEIHESDCQNVVIVLFMQERSKHLIRI